ncbi:MAG TPA: MotA/TolQ/ExbB proton channel family protein [Abditibacteriaceae bacterium]|nr:MotA/TolQ/ExbB proton channel family protein [Abditibacteriaceae bacterium]
MLHIFQSGGWMMLPLLALSLFSTALIIERVLVFRQIGALSPHLASRLEMLCEENHFDEALQLCERTNGPLAACCAVTIRHRDARPERIERLVEATGQEYFLRLERGLNWLDTATTISPLLGLLGTIVGMIGAFNAIAAQSSASAPGNNDAVLRGVAEALYATAFGIVIAVVCFIAYNAFAARLRTVTAETEQAVTRLINVLHDDSPTIEYSMAEEKRAI